MKGNIFFRLVLLIVVMMSAAGNAMAQSGTRVDHLSFDHAALTANNAVPVPAELIANTNAELNSDCPATTTWFGAYINFSLGKDNYYTESEEELAGIRVNISALGATDNMLFTATDVVLSLNRLEPLKSYYFEFTGVEAADVRKIEVTQLANSYQVNSEIEASKVSLTIFYESITEVDADQAVLSLTDIISLDGSFEHTFNWSVVSAQYDCIEVPSYQIQIMRVYGDMTLADVSENDWKGATNIFSESPETNLMLSLAEGTGTYVWRVRPIGSLLGDTKYALSNPANWDDNYWVADEFTFQQPQEDKNFIYSRTFTEKGRISEQLGFANGLGQVAQQQVKIHGETDQIIATQTLQDFVGRDALSTLPVPLNNTSQFGYKEKLLTKDGTNLLTKADFDADPQNVANAQVDGGYYSGNVTGVASAEGFPYSRAIFTNDGTSRVKEQSGVGATHAIKADVTNSHTTRTYYSSVEEAELLTIFGKEAPKASNVHKIITYDANGVASITYQDKAGKVIATALDAGSSAQNLDELPSAAGSSKQVFINVASKEERQNVYRTSSKKPLFFTSETNLTINYSLTPVTVEEICSQLCQTCDYNIEFFLHNQDEPASASILIGEHTIGPGDCATVSALDVLTFNQALSGGVNYILERRISTNGSDDATGVNYLETQLGVVDAAYTTAFNDALTVTLNPGEAGADPRTIASNLLLDTPAQLYADLKDQGYVLDEASGQYMVPVEITNAAGAVVCTEYILIPYYDYCELEVEPIPDANGAVNGDTWEDYFKAHWDEKGEDFGTLVGGKLAYAYFIDEYQKSTETHASKTQNREVDETQYTFYYAPGELDQMIRNLQADNDDRLSYQDIWQVWRNEVVTYKLYDDYANDGGLNDAYTEEENLREGGPELPVFKNNLVNRFFKSLETFLSEQRPESEENACVGNLYLKRNLLIGKIGSTEYPLSTEVADPKLEAHRLVYLNTDEEDRAIAEAQNSNEPQRPTRIDALRGLAGLSASTAVTIAHFNALTDCEKYLLNQMSAGFDVLERAGRNAQEGRNGVVSSCGELCETRSEEFKQAVVNKLMLRNSAHIIEKHTVSFNTVLQAYVAVYDENVNISGFDYSIVEVDAMVQAVVDNCKARYCNPDLVAGGIEGATYAGILEQVFNYNFELDLKKSDETCNPAEWDVISGEEVVNLDKQLWTVQDEGAECFESKYTSSVFDKSGNIYAVLLPVKDQHSYTLNNGINIKDDTGAGRFAVVKYNPSGDYLWHQEYYFLVNDGFSIAPATQTTGNSLPVSTESLLYDRQMVSIELDGRGGVSFNIGVYTDISFVGLGDNTWSLRGQSGEVLSFLRNDPSIVEVCSGDFVYNKLAVALSPTGTTQWARKLQEGITPLTSFNTVDVAGDSYVAFDSEEGRIRFTKFGPVGNRFWISDLFFLDNGSTTENVIFKKREHHVDGAGNSYLLQQAIYYGNDTDIQVREDGVYRSIGTMTDGLPYTFVTKFDAAGKFQWVYQKQIDATSASALLKDDYLVLVEKLSDGIEVSKVYSDVHVESQLLTGAPNFSGFSLLELPNNQVLIYSDQTSGSSVGATAVSLDDYSFTSGVDLQGSKGLNISDAYLDEANRQAYVGTAFSQSLVRGVAYQEGGFLAFEPETATSTMAPAVYDLDMASVVSNPSYMFSGGIDVDAYKAVLGPIKQLQVNNEATASNPAGTVNDADEYTALKALFDATNPTGSEWTDQTNWPLIGSWADPTTVVAADFADFYGVTVENGDIVAINLDVNGLFGALPTELEDLTKLRTLSLSQNSLTGSVPAALGQITSLVRLDLSENQLSSVPTGLGTLANLEYLSLSYNLLTAIPTDLSQLSALKFLQLAGNDLGAGLSDLSAITALEWLNLTTTNLTGTVPAWISSLTNLKVLLLNDNELTGGIPTTFSSLNQLVLLGLNENKLTGGLANLSTASSMELLDIGGNEFSTEVPLSVISLAGLKNLYVQGNLFDFDDFTNFQTGQMTAYHYYPQKTVVQGNTATSSASYTDGAVATAVTLSFVPEAGWNANSYQWQKFNQRTTQWENRSGETATAADYTIASLSLLDYGRYRVKLGDSNFPLLTLYSTEYVIGKGDEITDSKLVDPVICFKWTTARESSIALPANTDFWFDPVFAPTCESIDMDEIRQSIAGQKQALVLRKQAEFQLAYQEKCLDPENFLEEYSLEYSIGIHHYTLYYYDRAGNLIRTVPPKGVQTLDVDDASNLATAKTLYPAHTYKTSYQYNSSGQLMSQQTPDAGNTDFIYNDVGQLRFSQDAQQQLEGKFSYTHYDALSRIVEVGETTGDFDTQARANRNLLDWPASGLDVTRTVYNVPYTNETVETTDDLPSGYTQSTFLRNRISYTYQVQDGVEMEELTDEAGNNVPPVVTTIYSYDVHGNVEWLVQDIPGLEQKTIDYTYELLTNNVLEIAYNKDRDDNFYHRYSYDQNNHITLVKTSRDKILWENDADYIYYDYAGVRQINIGEDGVQQMDYLYTINSWLKSINDPSSNAGSTANVTRDAYAMVLYYYSGDYINYTNQPGKLAALDGKDLYNGNISAWENANQNKAGVWTRSGMQYTYDQLNRIKSSGFNVHRKDDGLGVDQFFSRKAFATNYTFDPNGNLLTLNRDDFDGELMDELAYTMAPEMNRLASVIDNSTIATEKHADDIEGLNSYQYDAIGNLVLDEAAGISIDWTVYGKVRATSKTTEAGVGTTFMYDAAGNRVIKRSTNKYGLVTSDYYIRDASGNVMAIYKATSAAGHSESAQSEVPLYGSDRLGMYKPESNTTSTGSVNHTLSEVLDLPAYAGVSEYYLEANGGVRLLPGFEFNAGVEADQFLVDQAEVELTDVGNLHTRTLNKKVYELKDHLGNIRATVSDVRQPLPDGEEGYMATVLTSSDYYPYGMDRTPVVWEPVEYLATYEDNDYQTFLNHEQADVINASDFNHTQETGTSHSQRLNADAGKAIGLGRMLYVKPGDKVSMEVFGTYRATNADPQNLMTNLAVALVATIPGTDVDADFLRNSINTESAMGTFFNRTGNGDVKAYLNYLFFDGINFQVDNDYSGFVPLTSAGEFKPSDLANSFEHLSSVLVAEKEGFLYIYLSDESSQPTEVYFDDFKITHEVLIKDPQLDAYRYGFNGKEKDSNGEFGLNHYDYGFRIYNPSIAKFLSVDPLTKSYPMLTPYQFASNRPIDGIDLDGLEYYRGGQIMFRVTPYSEQPTLDNIIVSTKISQQMFNTISTKKNLAGKHDDGKSTGDSFVTIRRWAKGAKNKFFTGKISQKHKIHIKSLPNPKRLSTGTKADLVGEIINEVNLWATMKRTQDENVMRVQLIALGRADALVNAASNYLPKAINSSVLRSDLTNYMADGTLPKIGPSEGYTIEYVNMVFVLGGELFNNRNDINDGVYQLPYVQYEVISFDQMKLDRSPMEKIIAIANGFQDTIVTNVIQAYLKTKFNPTNRATTIRSGN